MSYLTEDVRHADLVESVRNGRHRVQVERLRELVQLGVVDADLQLSVDDLRFGRRRPVRVAVFQLTVVEHLVHAPLQQIGVLVGEPRDLEHRLLIERLDGEMAEVVYRVIVELLDEHVLERSDQADLREEKVRRRRGEGTEEG